MKSFLNNVLYSVLKTLIANGKYYVPVLFNWLCPHANHGTMVCLCSQAMKAVCLVRPWKQLCKAALHWHRKPEAHGLAWWLLRLYHCAVYCLSLGSQAQNTSVMSSIGENRWARSTATSQKCSEPEQVHGDVVVVGPASGSFLSMQLSYVPSSARRWGNLFLVCFRTRNNAQVLVSFPLNIEAHERRRPTCCIKQYRFTSDLKWASIVWRVRDNLPNQNMNVRWAKL